MPCTGFKLAEPLNNVQDLKPNPACYVNLNWGRRV